MEPRPTARGKMSTKRLERLSEVIIDTLKVLSTQQQKLTPESLSLALKEREDFWKLLQGNGKQIAEQTSTVKSESPPPPPSLSAAHLADDDHDPSRGASLETSDEVDLLSEFYRKSTLALLNLVQEAENQELSASLHHLRSLILGNSADLGALDSSLHQIKNLIIKETLDSPSVDSTKSSGSSSFWNFLQRRSKPHKGDAPVGEPALDLRRVQQTFLSITQELQLDLGQEYLSRLSDLKGRFETSKDLEALLESTDDLVSIIQNYVQHAAQQREEVANFVKELGAGLLEMENHLISSLSHTEETYQFNEAFSTSLHGQLEDIKESFSISKSFEEVRSFVLGKLKTIRSALENKRKQDESYLKNAHDKMGSLQKGFEKMKKEVGQVHKKTKILEQEILLDSLTGIYNRRAYELRIKEELSRYHRYNQPFSLVMFDIDHFKKVNDQFGHQAGDKCLREITARIRPSLRHSDFLARYGGEEFIIILPGISEDDAHRVAEKVRNLIAKTRFLYQGAEVPVTISLGLTQVKPTDENPEILFQRADTAMYQAKKGGRNQTRRQ